MDFARQQRDPTRHLIGIAFVVLVHALVIWALITGLGKQMVEVIKKPLSATIIEEIKAPPPPPPPPRPKKIVEPPKVQVQQPYVPPPDIPPPVQPSEPVIASVAPDRNALVIWALITGLGKQMVEVIKKPLSATIIEEIKAPPPPPPPPRPKKIVEPPKVQVQQPYVPPPDIPPPVQPSEPVIASVA